MEKVPRALASTPAAFSLESRLPLERELACKCVPLKARLQRQRLPFDTSSQFTPRRPDQRGPPTPKRRSRWRLPHHSVKLVEAQLRRQRLPLDTSSQFTPRRPGQRGPQTQERRSRSRLPRNSRKLVEAQPRRQQLPFDTSSQFTLRRPALAREAPKHRNGALARDFLASY